MTPADADIGPAAWTAEDQRWYADLVMQCMQPNQSRAAINVPAVLRQLDEMPLDRCLKMRGRVTLEGRLKDIDGLLWSPGDSGRWFANFNGKKVWLGRKLAGLRRGLRHGDVQGQHVPSTLKGSHNCGHCDCIRWQHVRYQPKSEDVLDREHHKRFGRVLRPELQAVFVRDPQLLTPNQPARYRSPATSVDLPRPQMSSVDLV